MDILTFEIEGISPLMCHSPAGMLVKPDSSGRARKSPSPEEEAELGAYRTADGYLAFPSIGVRASILEASKQWKVERQRASYKGILSHIQLGPAELLPLYAESADKTGFEYLTEYEIDARPVVIQKARIIRCRPKIQPGWRLQFEVHYDPSLFGGDPADKFRAIIADAGSRVGVGEWRPTKGGWYGRFKLVD